MMTGETPTYGPMGPRQPEGWGKTVPRNFCTAAMYRVPLTQFSGKKRGSECNKERNSVM